MIIRSWIKLPAFGIMCCISLVQCRSANRRQVKSPDTVKTRSISVKGSFITNSHIKLDTSKLAVFFDNYPDLSVYKTDVNDFYKRHNYQYVWFDKNGMIEQSHNLITRLLDLKNEGVNVPLSYEKEFKSMVGLDSLSSGKPLKADPETEIMLTSQYFFFADKVWSANRSSDVKGWYLPRKKLSYSVFLDSVINKSDSLSEPVISQYTALKNQLQRYREIEKSGALEPLTVKSRSLKLVQGDTSYLIKQVKKYLFLVGDLAQNDTTLKYDEDLKAAVNSFKSRMGQREDGIINKQVIAQINVPVSELIKKIIVNMERCRWVPTDYEKDRYILVNIPEYKLHYFKNKELVFNSDVVVGKSMTRTVIFGGQMKYIVFSPYWYIPPSIIKSEIRPGIARNPNYLANHNMEWNGGNVRQKPGPNNSLGLVKFIFPNSNNIYLHDTPAKSLFYEEVRAFSHGCIRVAKPRELAVELLKEDKNWDGTKIDKAMHAGKERSYTLQYPVSVYIGYFTSWVDHNGKLNFRNDIYNLDGELEKMLLNE